MAKDLSHDELAAYTRELLESEDPAVRAGVHVALLERTLGKRNGVPKMSLSDIANASHEMRAEAARLRAAATKVEVTADAVDDIVTERMKAVTTLHDVFHADITLERYRRIEQTFVIAERMYGADVRVTMEKVIAWYASLSPAKKALVLRGEALEILERLCQVLPVIGTQPRPSGLRPQRCCHSCAWAWKPSATGSQF